MKAYIYIAGRTGMSIIVPDAKNVGMVFRFKMSSGRVEVRHLDGRDEKLIPTGHKQFRETAKFPVEIISNAKVVLGMIDSASAAQRQSAQRAINVWGRRFHEVVENKIHESA